MVYFSNKSKNTSVGQMEDSDLETTPAITEYDLDKDNNLYQKIFKKFCDENSFDPFKN